jgi:hypothetical protein
LGFFNDFFRVSIVVLRSDSSDWFNLEKRVLAQLVWFLGFFFKDFNSIFKF